MRVLEQREGEGWWGVIPQDHSPLPEGVLAVDLWWCCYLGLLKQQEGKY